MKKILVCDDENSLLNMLSIILKKEGYDVICAQNGKEIIEKLKENIPDLIVLDVMLPDVNGFDILKTISSKYKIPILMLTAKSDIIDKVLGLEFGADDYITKPFDTREFLARVKALLRRMEEVKKISTTFSYKELFVDFDQKVVKKSGNPLNLTPKEFELLKVLIEAKGTVLSRDELLDRVWGYDYCGDTRTVDIHILRLRKKIEDDVSNPVYILTVYGFGYKLGIK
ncbi:two-component system, OmpR family, alkaline phosphatase synthesis response regulator PhoP [Thermoanaerobacter uzonensis DSM 18761]|uniref:Stage 0 sporulation protein A homolog n=1 Tax=Thermoanaerobacter uzonensis DSM 18761 TaxID=1123369 RepID=A0A1M4YIC5_9THEO|nr:response regulator transcription factor [Thermoanaerobacter uzonensis]SHF05545.1 two-component system, OmpR family, alkaline phosphatase synthesis response regulator PhoP [Thermoanaerobacter uzonensis DSM 18761]